MTHEELESYFERFRDIMKCKDERIKSRRLLSLQMDLQETYNIPRFIYWERYSKTNPEVANLYRLVVEAISNSLVGRLV